MGLAQRVVVARGRAPRDAVVQNCLQNLGFEHPDLKLEGSARSVIQSEGVLPKAAPCVAFTPIDLDGQVDIVVDVPPRYTNSFVWLYTWSTPYSLNVAVDFGIPFVRKQMIPVSAFDMVRPNAAHTTTITLIILLSFSGGCETTPASTA